jgi:hypothetical protein
MPNPWQWLIFLFYAFILGEIKDSLTSDQKAGYTVPYGNFKYRISGYY